MGFMNKNDGCIKIVLKGLHYKIFCSEKTLCVALVSLGYKNTPYCDNLIEIYGI